MKVKHKNNKRRGTEFKMLFGSNSADFEWEQVGKNIRFICTRFDHGVGMSQYGANSMAKMELTYRHYKTLLFGC